MTKKSSRKNYLASLERYLPEDAVYDVIDSPVGSLWLIASDKGLHSISWDCDFFGQEGVFSCKKSSRHPVILQTKKELKEYFAGERKDFDVPLAAEGTTFQKKAWKQLQKIPYGKTVSYQKQAIKLGDAKKCRAVGTANSQNPISIIVPCHRVIAKSGGLSGFGGGVERKRFLLDLETASELKSR